MELRTVKEYYDGWAFLKNGVEIAFYSKIINAYTFNNINSINCAVISEEDLEWFRDFLH